MPRAGTVPAKMARHYGTDADLAAQELAWALRRANDDGQQANCVGIDMQGAVPSSRTAVCWKPAECPVRQECLQFGLAVCNGKQGTSRTGIYGGHHLRGPTDVARVRYQLDQLAAEQAA